MLLEDDEQFEHEESWMEDCQGTYLKLSTDTEDFLKEQLVLSQSSHEKGITGTSVTVSPPGQTTENFVSQDEIHTESTANQKGKTAISPSVISLVKNTSPKYRILSPIKCKLPIT